MVYCAKCGAENTENSNVCTKCGTSLRQSQPSRTIRSGSVFGFSRSALPSLIVGALIIIVGFTYSFGRDFGQIVGGWAENFGETMGTWGENFGEVMGAWGENVGRIFSEWGMSFGRYFGASILIIIGILIVTTQLKRKPAYH